MSSFDLFLKEYHSKIDAEEILSVTKFTIYIYIQYINQPLNDTIRFRNSFVKNVEKITILKNNAMQKNISLCKFIDFFYNMIVDYYKIKNCTSNNSYIYNETNEEKLFEIFLLLVEKLIDSYKEGHFYLEKDLISKVCKCENLYECKKYLENLNTNVNEPLIINKIKEVFNEASVFEAFKDMTTNHSKWDIYKFVKLTQKIGYENYTKTELPSTVFNLLNFNILSMSIDFLIKGLLGNNSCLVSGTLKDIIELVYDMIYLMHCI